MSTAASATHPHEVAASAFVHAACLALSVALHGLVFAPYIAWAWVRLSPETPGDEGPQDAPVGNEGGELLAPPAPVRISVYEGPKPKASRPKAEPPPEEPPAPETAAAADGTATEATEPAPAGEAAREGVAGKPPRGKKKPCEPIEEVELVEENKWKVERDLLDWYATHLKELEKQAGVAVHRDEEGNRDGARVFLPRCSVLKQGGFKNGDIIRSVNGRKVFTIPQAVATYLAVRNDKTITVELTRKGEPRTHKYKLK